MIFECPGAQNFKQPQPESVRCGYCGGEVEIWSDEIQALCPGCGRAATRRSGQSCLDWCRYAKECAGREIYDKYIGNKKGGN